MTRDHGSERLIRATLRDPIESETVVRFLDREAEIETSYGGNFVEEINGIRGGSDDGERQDWFFYVNGYWSPVGAAEARVRPGDRIWWDLRRWEAAYRVPVVVGSWPEPFLHGHGGDTPETVVECVRLPEACALVRDALREAGARLANRSAAADSLRVLVGELRAIGTDADTELLAGGPGESGVYARPNAGGRGITALDESGAAALELGPGSGLVAAVRRGERAPSWIVTGIGRSGVEKAAAALEREMLEDAYALAIGAGGKPIPLPLSG